LIEVGNNPVHHTSLIKLEQTIAIQGGKARLLSAGVGPDADVDKTLVRFVPDKVGVIAFFCDIFCGSGHEDMSGTITVVD
jgi:hypothetical protein